jgi:hypothetical protein
MASPASGTYTSLTSSGIPRYTSSYLAGASSSSALTGSLSGSSSSSYNSYERTPTSITSQPTAGASTVMSSTANDDYLGNRHRSSYVSSLDAEPTRSLTSVAAAHEYKSSDSSDDDDSAPDPILGGDRYYSSSSTRNSSNTRLSGGSSSIIPSSYDTKSPSSSSSLGRRSGSGGRRIRGLVGLANLGNTCFMNSCLQCLLSTPPVIDYFASGRYSSSINKKSRTKGQLAIAFGQLAVAIRDGRDQGVEHPTQLKRLVAIIAPQFAGYGQHDSQEFLRFLLMGLHDDTNRIVNPPPYVQIKVITSHTFD